MSIIYVLVRICFVSIRICEYTLCEYTYDL
jgi:hypothetical protein